MSNAAIQIGFIGTGVMGSSMAGHLIKAGYSLSVYNRSQVKALPLIEQGARSASSPAEMAANCNVIITMIGYPADVENIYLGEDGLIANGKPDSVFIDMTTSSPALAEALYCAGKKRGIRVLDAPVSGGDIGAKNATLSIMIGGDKDVLAGVLPILQCMGSNIVHQGEAGAGQHTKMCNQIAIASNLLGVCEAIVYAEKAGLDPETVLRSIESGAAGSWSLSNLAPRMIAGNFAPGFYIKHFIKDMNIALQSAQAMGILTPGLQLVKTMFEELAAVGEAESGTQALYKLLKKKAGMPI